MRKNRKSSWFLLFLRPNTRFKTKMKKTHTDHRTNRRTFENDRHESRFKSNFRQKEQSGDKPKRSSSFGERSERSSRFEKDEKFSRSGGRDRRFDRSEKDRRFDRSEKDRRFDRPEKDRRFDRAEKSRRFDRSEKDGRFERTEKDQRFKNNFVRNERPARRPKTEKQILSQEFNGQIRLNKFIANSGVCSRREADELIGAGVVTVNGEVITELGVRINPDKDDIRFNGERLRGEEKVYVLMNKPKGYVTTTSDPHADACVMDLISPDLCPQRIFPVGRLDKSTTGVLLLTNDGALAEKLTHPSYNRKKIYHVFLDKNLKRPDFETLLTGFDLEDGFIAADALSYIDEHEDEVGMEIHSGRNRIVRRMFEHLGYTVKKLDRVYFAGLTKKNLKRGQWRFLTDSEVVLLKNGQYE
ncbi:MAG: pseudouridine synthase [Bacteroidales bacterium]|nr:pseudouridine synthase [Bacteroidales bacterium]